MERNRHPNGKRVVVPRLLYLSYYGRKIKKSIYSLILVNITIFAIPMNIMEDGILPLIAGTALIGVLVVFIILFVVLYKKAQLNFKLERQGFEQALLKTEVEIREQTLADISRDLHDNFGQVASLIKINLNMVSEKVDAEDRHRISESKNLLRKLIEDMRHLSSTLNNNRLEETGLLKMIERDIDRVNTSGFINMKYSGVDADPDLAPHHSVFLYRMFQEMVNNILKHSEATEATVKVENKDEWFSLQVSDNGIGMVIPSGEADSLNKNGNGLKNIRERCRIIGAECTMESSPNRGTFIEVTLSN